MLTPTRRAEAAAARRAAEAARAHLSRLTLAPGMAARVDHHRHRNMGYIVTTTAWWDHPVTGARVAARQAVSAASGEFVAKETAERTVAMLHTRLRADWTGADA